MIETTLIEQDQQARRQALDTNQSFIVEAPAGSGKTELLIQRFLALLNTVDSPEEILAITFTKKAANEMRTRIIHALKLANEQEPHESHKKLTWQLARSVQARDAAKGWHLSANPNQLRVQTIDALCAFLTQQLPLLSQFGAKPAISDYPIQLYRQAVEEILKHLEGDFEWSLSISTLLLHLDNDMNKLNDLLMTLLSKRDQWLPYIHLNTTEDEIKEQLERHLSCLITENLKQLAETIPIQHQNELVEIARFAASNLSLNHPDAPLVSCASLQALPSPSVEGKTAWIGLANLLLTKSLTWRKRLDSEIGFPPLAQFKNTEEKKLHQHFRDRLKFLIESLSTEEQLHAALSTLAYLPDAKLSIQQWEILKALFQVLKIAVAQLRLTFKQNGQIDFIENTQAALLALGTPDQPTDLALALDYQIKHILIDEFQDTSLTQYQLLQKLIMGWEDHDGRTLFVVGDPMQSIYRFREAEVGLFLKMLKQGIGNLQLHPLALTVNFRSLPEIVSWNNKHFKTIFPAFNEIATGAVAYTPSVKLIQHYDTEGIVSIKGFTDVDAKLQGIDIASLVAKTKEDYPQESIAILVRSRSHLEKIIPELKKLSIPFQALEIDPLSSRQCIQDLLSLTCALLHPADRIAWLSILRAPWCGLTLRDLFVLSNQSPHAILYENLQNQTLINKMTEDGKQRVSQLMAVLTPQLQNRDRFNLRCFIEETWQKLGGPATLNEYANIDLVKTYFQLLENFNQHTLLLNVDFLRDKINTLYASAQVKDPHCLQIMTIHSAKGLEFDTVIVPHLERKIPYDNKGLFAWMEYPLSQGNSALLLAPIHATGEKTDLIYDFISRQQRFKADYEVNRLLYVAVTRAKKRLHLFFNASKNEADEYNIEPRTFLEKLWPSFKNQTHTIMHSLELPPALKAIENDRMLTRLTANWLNPLSFNTPVQAYVHQASTGFTLPSSVIRVIGIITHQILQQMSMHGMTWWNNETQATQQAYLHHHLFQNHISPQEIIEATPVLIMIVSNILKDERAKWLLQAHQEARSEWALSHFTQGQIKRSIIDRTFVENGIRWIIDYKTSTMHEIELDEFLQNEKDKYNEKMTSYAEVIRQFDTRPIQFGLYFPLIPAWHTWHNKE
ncbi:MAG: UvrD-helicase domain-containing protein [Gammaproteobacteria bacterium]|nr:UvrD-helicase domain-containing protein [Gammaproteobacteria bacterium]